MPTIQPVTAPVSSNDIDVADIFPASHNIDGQAVEKALDLRPDVRVMRVVTVVLRTISVFARR